MIHSFLLAWRALVRGHVLTLLLAATALVHVFLPALVRSDGTAAGWREMFVRAVPGTTYVVTAIAILSCACGFFAQERTRVRLSLTVVRPVSAFAVACGKWLALCAVAAVVTAFMIVLTGLRVPDAPNCMFHRQPALPPAAVTAQRIIGSYLADPKTPDYVKKAPRSAVLRLLTNKELDHYEVIRSGESRAWPFSGELAGASNLLVRVRFATQFDLRSPLEGAFAFGGLSAVVTNNTQSILDIPLAGTWNTSTGLVRLAFTNTGKESVMLRPRRDLEVLAPADSFRMNLFRAWVQMWAALAFLAAFGLFLSSALSRPVAVFTALVSVAVALMVPSVLMQFPDEVETSLTNRIGLVVSRAIGFLTSSAADESPISDLATDTCIEWGRLLKGVLSNAVLLPAGLLGLAAVIVRRKPLEDRT